MSEFLPDADYPLPATAVRAWVRAGLAVEGVYGNLFSYTVRFVDQRGATGGGSNPSPLMWHTAEREIVFCAFVTLRSTVGRTVLPGRSLGIEAWRPGP